MPTSPTAALVRRILSTRAVRSAVARDARDKNISRRQALLEARRYLYEIAANYSQPFILFMERALARLWDRIYDGVQLHHLETLHDIPRSSELVFVPCHRSHMDYLLLGYIIYKKGFSVPYTAAGVNLNLPIVGRFLRKGGAFFIRRTFKGNTLYPAVFIQYLSLLMDEGHSLEYFIEGGRSRTGRLLQPKTGMLAMTVRSHLLAPKRPVTFIPVYFGYERLMEGKTYIDELSGRPKKKESVLGLLRTLPALREKFGKVHVSFGEPIALDALLVRSGIHADPGTHGGINTVIDDLARAIMVNINSAAVVTPVNMLAMVLLAMPRQAMLEADLIHQLELYRELLGAAPYSNRVVIAALNGVPAEGAAIVRYGEDMQILERRAHPLGDILRMSEQNAILMTYFRNNVLHLFAMPSLLACCFLNNAAVRTQDLQRLTWRIYPYIADELFLPWRDTEIAALVPQFLDLFAEHRLLESNAERSEWRRRPPIVPEAMQLSILAQGTIQIVERYYLAIAILVQAGSGVLTQEALVSRCRLAAERMSILYGLNAPEFFDRALFDNFIELLRQRNVLQITADGGLAFGEILVNVANDAQLVLSEHIRHSILQVTQT